MADGGDKAFAVRRMPAESILPNDLHEVDFQELEEIEQRWREEIPLGVRAVAHRHEVLPLPIPRSASSEIEGEHCG